MSAFEVGDQRGAEGQRGRYNWQVVLPLLARSTFHGDARIVGLMFTSMGLGAIVGGLLMAGSLRATSGRLVALGITCSGLMIAVALAPNLAATWFLLFVLGGVSISFRAVANSMMQLRSEPAMRGRVVALLIMALNGTTPIGGPPVGWVSETFTARAALALGGLATAVTALAVHQFMKPRSPIDP